MANPESTVVTLLSDCVLQFLIEELAIGAQYQRLRSIHGLWSTTLMSARSDNHNVVSTMDSCCAAVA